jgi:hypothetical protein
MKAAVRFGLGTLPTLTESHASEGRLDLEIACATIGSIDGLSRCRLVGVPVLH